MLAGHSLGRPSKSLFPGLVKSDLPVWGARRFPRQLHDGRPLLVAISEALQQKAFIAFLHYFDLGWALRHGNRTKIPEAGSFCAICSCTICQRRQAPIGFSSKGRGRRGTPSRSESEGWVGDHHDRPVVLKVKTEPEVAPLPPHVTLKEARAFMSAIAKGDGDAGHVIGETAGQVVGGLFGNKD
jgi:hypothetical protein